MAIFDPVEQRLFVRLVYDGVAGAGKTTNLRFLQSAFAFQPTAELFSPGELRGRTLYFDWIQIRAGTMCGLPVTCQLISVPGQMVLSPRRRRLLAQADVVVFVCESAPAGIERAREGLALVDEVRAGKPLPLLVQANKQDQDGALGGPALRGALGRQAPVVEAIATEGVGVVDTFIGAVREMASFLESRTRAGESRIEVARAPGAGALLRQLRQEAVDPEWAVEMLLEEAHAAFLVAGGFDEGRTPGATARIAHPSLPRADVEPGLIWPAHAGRSALQTIASAYPDPNSGRESVEVPVDAGGRAEIAFPGMCAHTSRPLRFEDRELAREALVRAARERRLLERNLVPGTVLVIQPARDGAWWLWSIVREKGRVVEPSDGADAAAW